MNLFSCCTGSKTVNNIISRNEPQYRIKTDGDNFKELKIGTFDASLDQSIYKNDKIKMISEMITSEVFEIDIFCLQNIVDVKTTKLMIEAILKNATSKLYFFPSIFPLCRAGSKLAIAIGEDNESNKSNDSNETNKTCGTVVSTEDVFRFTFSRSSDEYTTEYQNIIVSKYPIVNGATLSIGTVFNINSYANIANINYHGSIISVYNATLQIDFTGISNKKIRESQLKHLNNAINENRNFVKTDKTFHEYYVNDINILCCDLNIMEYKNNGVNDEFIKCVKTVKGLDLYKFVQRIVVQKEDKNDFNNKTARQSYIMLILSDYEHFEATYLTHNDFRQQLLQITKYIYDTYKIVIKGSYTKKNVDYYFNYPTVSSLLINISKDPKKVVAHDGVEIAVSID
jgi:hypothetical protein